MRHVMLDFTQSFIHPEMYTSYQSYLLYITQHSDVHIISAEVFNTVHLKV